MSVRVLSAATPVQCGLKMEEVNKQDIVVNGPSGYQMNKSTHPVDLEVCDLTLLSLPPLLV